MVRRRPERQGSRSQLAEAPCVSSRKACPSVSVTELLLCVLRALWPGCAPGCSQETECLSLPASEPWTGHETEVGRTYRWPVRVCPPTPSASTSWAGPCFPTTAPEATAASVVSAEPCGWLSHPVLLLPAGPCAPGTSTIHQSCLLHPEVCPGHPLPQSRPCWDP